MSASMANCAFTHSVSMVELRMSYVILWIAALRLLNALRISSNMLPMQDALKSLRLSVEHILCPNKFGSPQIMPAWSGMAYHKTWYKASLPPALALFQAAEFA